MNEPNAPRVLIWRWLWLPASETFIRNQVDSYSRWSPISLGGVHYSSNLVRPDDAVLFGSRLVDKMASFWLRLTGSSHRLERVIKQARPHVLHAHFAPDAMKLMGYARRRRLPLVVTLHGYDVTSAPRQGGLRGWRYRFRLKRLFRIASAYVAVSDHIAEQAVAWGAARSRLHVIKLGVPPRPAPASVRSASDIVAVGRLVEKKGMDDLLRAIAGLPDALRATVNLRIFGDGPMREELIALAAELDLDVSWEGHVSPDHVEVAVSGCALVVIPSRTARNGDAEGLPTVVFEAARAATPVVAFDHAGIGEAIDDGKTGILVAERDVVALSAAIEHLLADDDLRLSMGRRARERYEADFDMTQQTAVLEGLYDRLVARTTDRAHD
jgi:glycosyltransferase involved in cell wall biosynthesis